MSLLATLAILCRIPQVGALPPELAGAVPADALVAVLVDSARQETAPRASNPPLAQWAALVLSATGTPAVVADAVAALEQVRRFPWALVVTDVSAQSLGEGSYRLGELHAALIVYTRGNNAGITRQIQALLERWTSRDSARVGDRTVDDVRVYTLVDDRVPAWARVQWGAVGDFYVIALGDRAYEIVAQTLRGTHTSLAESGELFQAAEGDHARVAWQVRFNALRKSLGEVMAGKPDRVLAELGFANIDAACWSVRRDGRALSATMAARRGSQVTITPISQPVDTHPRARAALPSEATGYACIPHSGGDVLRRIAGAWLASRRPKVRENVTRAWRAFEADQGVSVRAGLLDQLGETILIHDYPLHPARLPIARSILFDIDGSADEVRTTLDALLTQCAAWINPDQRDADRGLRGFLHPQLERLPDGVWTLRAGLYGPAVAVHEHWVVIGYAPWAVRQNLAWLSPASQNAAAQEPAAQESATP